MGSPELSPSKQRADKKRLAESSWSTLIQIAAAMLKTRLAYAPFAAVAACALLAACGVATRDAGAPACPDAGALLDLLLPAIVLGVSLYATSMRLMRASTIDTLNQDWVRTAYSKGLSRRRVVPVHVVRNSLLPVITNSATNFGVLLVGATVTEGIFNVPGVGNTLYEAITRQEGPTVVSFVTVFVVVYVLVNLVVDLLYGLLDPRIRYAK